MFYVWNDKHLLGGESSGELFSQTRGKQERILLEGKIKLFVIPSSELAKFAQFKSKRLQSLLRSPTI